MSYLFICIDQVMDLRLMLHYLGVPIREKSYMFGDNGQICCRQLHQAPL